MDKKNYLIINGAPDIKGVGYQNSDAPYTEQSDNPFSWTWRSPDYYGVRRQHWTGVSCVRPPRSSRSSPHRYLSIPESSHRRHVFLSLVFKCVLGV